MARCKHERGNIQQFTEICLDCGRNIYESDTEYEKHLHEEINRLRSELQQDRISDLEKIKDELLVALNKKKAEEDDIGW